MAGPVACHHTRWDALESMDLDPGIAWQANLVMLVDRVDALMAPHYGSREIFAHAREVQAQIRVRSGTYFAPRLVELFLEASRPEAFWLMLEPRAIQVSLQDLLAQGRPYQATVQEVMGLARIFARIVDAKSPFTAEHSRGVASLARFLGERAGLERAACDKLEIAGLLHDLGKLRIPDEILDKPNRLDEAERQVINTHSFETYQILRRIQGFEEIALWAAYHHEEPGGRGYPFHLDADQLPLEARIMRVADIFQAMVQDRPYRHGLATEEVLAFLERLADQGRLDDKVLALATASLDEAMQVARG
ncbi:MAG TPA: HD domain-containing phosphohydrolase [Holophaga sp.]|nr:HD domain-containing phosphohydrolase [Holophaga sp.]